ncbi:Consortin [Fukomys damarensis]|uniref:Consortin n=1 Tax=Fukomys damarensis TaxID=885580 RepID=A0A091D6S9_FUKDA|nr:Consortin [Fukomys damarensis]
MEMRKMDYEILGSKVKTELDFLLPSKRNNLAVWELEYKWTRDENENQFGGGGPDLLTVNGSAMGKTEVFDQDNLNNNES